MAKDFALPSKHIVCAREINTSYSAWLKWQPLSAAHAM
jgi:hypothetical protein